MVSVEWLVSDKNQKILKGSGQFSDGHFTRQAAPLHPQCFDLASLTKMILTSTLMIEALLRDFGGDWGRFLDLDLRSQIPELGIVPSSVDLRIRSLWEHRSSLPAHFSLAGDIGLRQRFTGPRSAMWTRVVTRLCEELRIHTPSSAQTEYSDVGFWILGMWLERSRGKNLLEQWNDWKKKFGLAASDLVFESELNSKCLPTETRHPAGEVNDDNAHWMHGIAPHAGLFGTIDGVRAWLDAVKKWTKQNPELKFWIEKQPSSLNRFWMGWDTASLDEKSQAGSIFAPRDSIGHLGWTGTSFWWSPHTQAYGILLTNRVFPEHTVESQKWIRDFRKEFFSDLWQSKIEAKWLP